MDESLEACGAGHSYMGEGPVEENQDWFLSDIKSKGETDWPDNEHGPGEKTEGWKLGLARRMKPEQRDKLGKGRTWKMTY